MCRAGLHVVSRLSSGLGHHPFTMGITGSNPVRDTRGPWIVSFSSHAKNEALKHQSDQLRDAMVCPSTV